MPNVWEDVTGPSLCQGDLLPQCAIPILGPNYGKRAPDEVEDVPLAPTEVIVITQSCDLQPQAGGKSPRAQFVAICPVHTLAAFSARNANYSQPQEREKVRQGRVEGLHMLPSPQNPENNAAALLVVFREIHSLPFAYVSAHADSLGARKRLNSPYLERLSQGFARFFMRVGLPTAIPKFI